MVYRQLEILRALHNNLDGLTTEQIIEYCSNYAGSELPKTLKEVNAIIFSMRSTSPRPIKAIDQGSTKLYSITPHGESLLLAEMGDEANDTATVKTKPKAVPKFTVQRKAEKISLLKMMQTFFGKFNEDVEMVLGEIINDYAKF